MNRAILLDGDLTRQMIRQRKKQGTDLYDEVWEGVYVMASMPSMDHQEQVQRWVVILDQVVVVEKKGNVYPGANVSDRRIRWKKNFRVPDIVVVLNQSRAVNCGTHLYGGPDFLTEIKSPDDQTEKKLGFYSKIQVQELLIIHRDSRKMELYRHDGQELKPVTPSVFQGGKWLVSQVLPLAFRQITLRGQPAVEIHRTDGKPGNWTV